MRHVPTIVGALLGLAFVAFSLMYFFDLMPAQEPPAAGSPQAHFFAAFAPTGYMSFVKVCELAGGVLTAIPRTRCLGLLLLGPVLVNIIAFHVFVKGDGLADPIVIALSAMAVFLVLAEHKAFGHLLTRSLPARG